MVDDREIERALDYLRTSAAEAAIARANVKYLSEFLDVKKAQIIKAMSGVSASAAKELAKADPAYLEVLEGYRAAIELDARHQFKREAADATIRAWQTWSATQRAESRAYS